MSQILLMSSSDSSRWSFASRWAWSKSSAQHCDVKLRHLAKWNDARRERDRLAEEYGALMDEETRGGFQELLGLSRTVFPYVEEHKFYCDYWFQSRFFNKVREFGALLAKHGFIEEGEDIFNLSRHEAMQALEELSLTRARQAFEDVEFSPSILRPAADVDTSSTILGGPSALPFAIGAAVAIALVVSGPIFSFACMLKSRRAIPSTPPGTRCCSCWWVWVAWWASSGRRWPCGNSSRSELDPLNPPPPACRVGPWRFDGPRPRSGARRRVDMAGFGRSVAIVVAVA